MAEATPEVAGPAAEKGPQGVSSDPTLRTASLDNEFAVDRMVSMPLVSSIYDLAPDVPSHDSSSCLEATCKVPETKPEPGAAAARPAQLEHEFETVPAAKTPSNGLGKGPQQPPKQVVTETSEPLPSEGTDDMAVAAVAYAKEPSRPSRAAGARAAMTSSLRSLMSSKVGQLFLRSVDKALDKSEELMNRYLPVTEKELAALTMKGLDASAVEHHKKGCLVRLGSLSTSLRNRAFMLILNKLRLTRQNTHENLSQLHQTIDLIEHIQQKGQLQGSQEKLRSMWKQWNQKQEGTWGPIGSRESISRASSSKDHCPTASSSKDHGPTASSSKDHRSSVSSSKDHRSSVSSSRDSGSAHLEVESKTLEMSRSLTQQLQATYLNLLDNVKDLPVHLQEKMRHVYENMAELHGYFSSANSVQDLSSSVLNQSRGKVAKAWEALDEVTEFLLQNPPVTWLVQSLVSLEGELLETEEPDILKVLQHYEPQDCKED
ncbi:perilipin-5 [Pelodiscus sinensis]|uniref:perilipin-5 n=1 Tax=Pelodiscus sinensis TaxID=13735 RepID=UPI003F6AB3EC